jgi:hypothetical protein
MAPEVPEEDIELAQHLLDEWNEGHGTSKSQLEIQTWGDATSHGCHFDRNMLHGEIEASTRCLDPAIRTAWRSGLLPVLSLGACQLRRTRTI